MLDPKVHTLLSVAQTGSFTAAAQALNLTQPAVSHHIRLLEKEYGVTIFLRGSKSIRLTPEGEILLKYARRLAAVDEDARNAIAAGQNGAAQLHVGLTQTAGENLMPRVFAQYCEEHPQTHIHILTDTIANLYRKLALYELDFAIVEGILPHDNFPSILLDTDYLCLIVSVDHPFAHQQSVPLEDLKKEKLILRSKDAGTRMFFENFLWNQRESIQNFNIIMELDNIAMTKELVANNLGVSIIAKSACRDEIRAGKLAAIPIENGSMVREIHLVFHPDFTQTKLLGDFCQIYNALC